MLSAITVSLVPEASQGPFVFHAGLEDACVRAAELGFDAIEIFPPNAPAVEHMRVAELLAAHDLKCAAVGTGAGWLCHQLTLVARDSRVRQEAVEFVRSIIDAAGRLGAPAIIGSMQGRAPSAAERPATLQILGQAVSELANYASERYNVPLLIEPLNRYETNLLNEISQTVAWMRTLQSSNVRILADLFHMNIEEADMAAALTLAGSQLGHVHFADSNRCAVGMGHSPITDAVRALRGVHYKGYLSAEIFPRPDSGLAARQTISSFRQLTGAL